ncbi:hypothetical protein SAMN04487955_101375 [Halomonas korlensis]|uniref:O-antigen ligase like membrane protein n=1 Tax=Halomonas korlensis TaxID=463301 RepID=A0A1I7FBT8_9GAMM|nr:hypothetical protein SAMN04487955_101375 [Halomonas korlensis]
MRYSKRTVDVDSFHGGLRYIHGFTYRSIFVLTLFLYLYLLSPYFNLGGMLLHGGMIAIVLFLGMHPLLAARSLQQMPLLLTFIALCFFCLYNLVVIIFYMEAFSTSFQNYVIQVGVYIMIGFVLAFYLIQKALDMDQALTLCFKLIVFVVFVNSAIILLEYQFPAFRALVESILYLPENSNINYLTREYRLRGIASGGAANLSLFHGTILVLLQALYIKRKISFIYFLVASITIFTSLLFIGRTGIVVGFIGIVLFHILNLMLSKEKVSMRRVLIYASVTAIVVVAPPMLALLYPDSVLSYSISFLYQGVEGLEQEGTTTSLIDMFAMSDQWAKLFFGVGAHTGGFDLVRRVDAGYMRMFTALGIPLTIAFYLFVAYLARYVLMITHYKSFWIVFMIIMFIAEIKEPFIFKGYSARMMWMIIGMGLCYTFSSPFYADQREREPAY